MYLKKKRDKFIIKILNVFKYFSYLTSLLLIFFLLLSNNKLIFKNLFVDFSSKINHRLFGKSSNRVSNFNDMLIFLKGASSGILTIDDFPLIEMQISQKKILQLYSDNDFKKVKKKFVPVNIRYNLKNELINLKGKARLKGDRELHRESFDKTSFRLNLSKNDRLFGLEEFSIQKPLLRNYTWELLISDIFHNEKLLTLVSKIIKFSVNGDKRGLYVVEEVPSKITLERQKKKDGPIFGLNENYLLNTNGILDVYDLRNWENQKKGASSISEKEKINFEIYKYSKKKLYENYELISNNKKIINNDFAIEDWAKYFALSDLFGSYHGTQLKSVRIYFNPVNGKFYPILFDAHKGTGFSSTSFKDFILLDFLNKKNIYNCDFICDGKKFYLGFLRDEIFIKKYLYYLDLYSSEKFLTNIREVYKKKFEYLDNEFYSRFMQTDNVSNKAFSLYLFKFSEIEKRTELIRMKLLSYKDRNKLYSQINNKKKENGIDEILFDVPHGDHKKIKVIKLNNFNLVGDNLKFKEPTLIIFSGKNKLAGISDNKPLMITGPVMIYQKQGEILFENVKITEGVVHKIINRNLSGVINVNEAKVKINNLIINNSFGEDAINIINSEFKINKIEISNASSDAIDLDYSNGEIDSIHCRNIMNDCLDTSNSNVYVNSIFAKNVYDKIVSSGENSKLNIDLVKSNDSNIGLTSKDSSNLSVKKYYLFNVKIPISAYIKKPEYDAPTINVSEIISDNKNINALLGFETIYKLPNNIKINLKKSCEIYQFVYSKVNYCNEVN